MSKASLVRERVSADLVEQYTNVVGTGVGHKLVNGRDTGQQSLIVFVTNKLRPDTLTHTQAARQLLPRRIDDVPVDVVEVGNLVKHGYSTRVRPVVPGYSISHGRVTAGTLGGIFRDRDGQVVMLSNNHVLACEGAAKPGDLVFQPGTMDAPRVNRVFQGWDRAPDTPYVGTLKSFAALNPGGTNLHDSAIAVVHDRYLATKMVSTRYPNNAQLAGFGTARVGDTVQKFGRTTGHTTGRVIAVDAELAVGYDLGQITFRDLIVTDAMSQGGDSGSLLMDMEMNAVGLLFAGSDKVTLHNQMAAVRDHYGLEPYTEILPGDVIYWGCKWSRRCYGSKTITPNVNLVAIDTHMNRHAYLETELQRPLSRVACEVFTGHQGGASWGPGIALVHPGGVLKVNVRHNDGFGGAWAGSEVYGVGSSAPDRWYDLRVSYDREAAVCEAAPRGSRNWTRVLAVPAARLGGAPVALRVGKTDVAGGGGDYPDLGPVSRTLYANLRMS